MSIQAIKEKLSIQEVLDYYQLNPKNGMLHCPFHEDKTPSMQVFADSNSVRCYSGNCSQSNKVIDVIDFIMYWEHLSKSEAIAKAKELANYDFRSTNITKVRNTKIEENFLQQMFDYFKVALPCSPFAKEYAHKRALNYKTIEIGYNSGQFHHGERKNPLLIQNALQAGLLLDKGHINNRTLEKAYYVFGNKSLVFPLKDKDNQIVSFYFRHIEEKEPKHLYLKDRKGLYPGYPSLDTEILILTESIIDCASLLQIEHVQKNYALLACYGTHGFTEEHRQVVENLKNLKEIVFAFDTDQAGIKSRNKLANDLRNHNPTLHISELELPNKDVNEVLQLHNQEILTELIKHRKELIFTSENSKEQLKSNPHSKEAVKDATFSLQTLNELIEQTGIIGEENTRLLLFIIASSYKTQKPLHAIVQGSSGSGKTHLISKIADLMPQEDVLRFTRITESSLYNWGEFDLVGKCMVIEDLDGLKEEALYSLREIISNHQLSSSVSVKDKKGNIKSTQKKVQGIFSSLSATTKGNIYEDNMSRSFVLAVDESIAQSQKIIDYQNKKYAGEVSKESEVRAKEKLQEYIRSLQDLEVINPYATKLQLPDNVYKKRRLNEMFQSIIRQITYLNQKNRIIKERRIYTEKQDLQTAIEVLFESILLKIDELDGSLRQFYENVQKRFKNKEFTRFQIMECTGLKKTQLQYYLNQLVQLEYLQQFGHANKGYKYKIGHSDNMQKVRKELKDYFTHQLEKL